ncbi:hypothetical protein KDN24_14950 [Bacillus sp. Bva_UNVM-123]|uniref:hypothetical protein n=1 Tax=Bacillus sp. Bva_UNVM-123 TaxID=2829798 RepID=UPI00391F013A
MRNKHIRNTEGVKKHAQMKSQETAQKVDQAIQRLIKTKAKNNRIKKLEEENKRLKEELLKLRGMIYDQI